MEMDITLRDINQAIKRAHGYTDYYPRTNLSIGPHNVYYLDGPSTSRYYDQTREWNTEIAIALAEEEFNVDLSNHDIVNEGPWRDTVKSIHCAVNAEKKAESEFMEQCTSNPIFDNVAKKWSEEYKNMNKDA